MQTDRLDIKLSRAYEKYAEGNYESGNKSIRDSEPYYRDSMEACPETNAAFEEMADRAHDFFAQENWRDIAEANYLANQVLIDQQWSFSLLTWDQGVPFNAGMFYGRVWFLLAYGQPI